MAETKRPTSESAEAILGNYYPVLNFGFVSLMDYMGVDATVPTCARTSYGHGTRATNNDDGLTRYLRRHKHTSPFEFVEFHFHCSMPIFVARQWVRHRTASINEVSGRYSLLPMLFYLPEEDKFAMQSKDNKQGRSTALSEDIYMDAVEAWDRGRASVRQNYEWLIGEDVARELARIDLPLSTYTQWRWKIDGHNLMHFLSLRCDSHAQWEVRAFANTIAGILEQGWPSLFNAWADYNFKAHTFSRQEMLILCEMLEEHEGGLWAKSDPLQDVVNFKPDKLAAVGLNKREVQELVGSFNSAEYARPHFELPEPRTFEYFEEMAQAAVPKTDHA